MEQTATEPVQERLPRHLLIAHLATLRRVSPTRMLALALTLLLVLVLVLAISYTRRFDGHLYRGVRVAGIAVGGLTRDEALARVNERASDWSSAPLPVGAAGQETPAWAILPAHDLSIRLDTAAAVDAAYAYGRDSNPLGNAIAWFGALVSRSGHDVAIPATVDNGQVEQFLRAWAPAATYNPTNAAFALDQNGRLIIVDDVHGLGFDLAANSALFTASAAHLNTDPVRLVTQPIPAAVNATMLHDVQAQANQIVSRPIALHNGDQNWTLTPAIIGSALGYRWENGQLVPFLDPARASDFLAEIDRAVSKPGVNARLVSDNSGKYSVTPSQDAFVFDRPATLAAIDAALLAGGRDVTITIVQQPPAVTAADLEPVRAHLERILATPVAVTFQEYRRTLVRDDILPLIRLVNQPGQSPSVAVALDQAGLLALSQFLAGEINQEVRDAQFKFANGAVRDVVSSRDGRVVQIAATQQALNDAILGATGTMSPVVAVTPPRVPSSLKATMQTPDVLGGGRTRYGGIASRIHNVELASERLNGALIPPGALFSFNKTVGAQTVANGYQEAYGIALVSSGEVKTVSSVAGGICQVSTTLFQGVFRAGLPIEQRNHHLFWVGYAASSTGLLGLDATVDDQSGLDFQFWNNTGGWIGIESVADGEDLYITLYGKDPGWKVEIDDPVITNMRPPDPQPAYEKTHDLPPGEMLMIEHETEGFDAAIRRRVYDSSGKPVIFNGKAVDFTFKSSYQASRDRYQVGVPENEPLTGPVTPPRTPTPSR